MNAAAGGQSENSKPYAVGFGEKDLFSRKSNLFSDRVRSTPIEYGRDFRQGGGIDNKFDRQEQGVRE